MTRIQQAEAQLEKDAQLRRLMQQIPLDYHWEPDEREAVYPKLINAIISQQISTKAAASIKARFLSHFDGDFPLPTQILDYDTEALRTMGLSRQKAAYVRNIAEHFEAKQLLDYDWEQLSDEDILKNLTTIKGVGEWTVHMILMFALNRPDVLPLGDLVIRNAMIRLYNVQSEGRQLKKDLMEIAEAWRPYRTLACYYLWSWKHRDFVDLE